MLVQAIHVTQGGERPTREVLLQPEIRRYLQDWGQPHDAGFVAVEATTQKPVGAAWLRLLTGDHKGYGYVDDTTPEVTVAVAPEFRGQGIGTRLLSQLVAMAQTRYHGLSLSVSPDNPALRLYERLGFQTVGTCGASLVMKRAFGSLRTRSQF